MKITILIPAFLLFLSSLSYSQENSKIKSLSTKPESTPEKSLSETRSNWGLNVSFSDNGYGLGATLYKKLSENSDAFFNLSVSSAKDDREFETFDIFGNSFTPFKKNRLIMFPLNIGMQVRLFKEDVSDNLRPLVSFGIAPTAIVYTPYDKSFFPSFSYAKAKYTVGGFAGIGVDYITSKTSSLSLNVRYYHTQLFGEGIESIAGIEKKQFGGLYFLFSYNFMK